MASEQALVSARLPIPVRDRLKAFAASRGESMQQVVARAVSRLLADETREPPARQVVMNRLKAMEADLRRDGVAGLWMFGSVARDAAHPGSDIDLAVEFAPSSKASLLTVARLQQDIQDALGAPVDIGIRDDLRPHVLEGFRRDAARVF
jgi:predicted nucleotidyltransferase